MKYDRKIKPSMTNTYDNEYVQENVNKVIKHKKRGKDYQTVKKKNKLPINPIIFTTNHS